MKQKIPMEIQPLMQAFLQLLHTKLSRDLVEGVYMYGSIAMGAFEKQKSDIDFVVLLTRAASEKEVEELKEIHLQLANIKWGNRLDGMYISKEDIGKTNKDLSPYPYCSEGILQVGYWDINHITWWVVREHGIVLQGTPIKELQILTNWNDVINTLKYNINEYWYSKAKEGSNSVSDEMVEFTTTAICRILYSLHNQKIISKKIALEIGVDTLPERWKPLLMEGLRIRTSKGSPSFFKTEISRAEACRDFVIYAHQLCNDRYFLEV